MAPTLRERLAARHFEIPDPVRKGARRAQESLSKAWHRDAHRLGRKALKLERQAEASLHGWFARLKPKVVRVEHRIDESLHRWAHRVRG